MKTPSAHLTFQKGRLKIYHHPSNNVYLQDGQTFEIELFNPLQEDILAIISINSKKISNSGIIIKPGQRIYLERYIDSANKFQFNTYEVEANEISKKAIELNGNIGIEFFTETKLNYSHIVYVDRPSYAFPTYTSPYYYGTGTINLTNGIGTLTTNSININSTTTNLNSATSTTTAGFNFNCDNISSYYTEQHDHDHIETGTVEQGEESSQLLINSHFRNWNYNPISTIGYRILPISLKPTEAEDLVAAHCTECGAKLKSNWKFCASCGNKL